MKDLSPQQIEMIFQYLENPWEDEPKEFQSLSELEVMSLQLILDQLKWERQDAVLH
jgi:hypothetical protein